MTRIELTTYMENGKHHPQVFEDRLGCGLDVMRMPDSINHQAERRKRPRFPLSWTVYLSRPNHSNLIETQTINISCEGFYCVVDSPFVVGEVIRSVLLLPTLNPNSPDRVLGLECQLTVVRMEFVGTNMYGVAFQVCPNWHIKRMPRVMTSGTAL